MPNIKVPKYATAFADTLLSARVERLQLDLSNPPIQGYLGILTTSRFRYNDDPINLLGRSQEFTFELPDRRVELSLQLYLNASGHYRLFCYTKRGMLFSLNLTLLQEEKRIFTLEQTIRLSTRGISVVARSQRAAQLRSALTNLGLEVKQQRVVLGTFDADEGRFVDTTANAFLRDFALAALLKGHYMGNKEYALPGLPTFSPVEVEVRTPSGAGRMISLSLRYQVLETAGGHCVLCGRAPKDGVKIHANHIKPFSQGGRTERSNLQALCHECNLGKGNRSEVRFE